MTVISVSIFLLSAAVLALEVVLVRALAIGHWHHFAYMVISTALLGFGAGGVFVCIFSKALTKHYKRWLWGLAFAFGLSVPIVFSRSQEAPFDELQLIWDPMQMVFLLEHYISFFVPFLCAGTFLALVFKVFSQKAHHLYFLNMAGSGAGSAVIVLLMYGHDPAKLLVVISSAGFLVALLLALQVSRRTVLYTLAIAFVFVYGIVVRGVLGLEINISEHKSLAYYSSLPAAETLAVRYSPLGRLDCVRAPSIRSFPGLSIDYEGQLPEQLLIISDGDGISAVNLFENLSELGCYDYVTSALGYHLVTEPHVCIIGAGGGSDVGQALLLGARKVTAVEINRQVMDLVRNELVEFSSGLYERDDVEVVIADGRNFLQTTSESFDVISISLLDSLSASAAGLYALNESHLYTAEAVFQALRQLQPGGVLSITRSLKTPARDSLKILATVAEALRRDRVSDPSGHIMMIRSWATATVVASPDPFSGVQIEAARRFARERGFDLVHVPGIEAEQANKFHILEEPIYYEGAQRILSDGYEEFYRDYAYNIRPATDDRPYFFDFFKWRSLPVMIRTLGRQWLPFSEWGYLVLVVTLLQAVLASGVFILLPLFIAKPLRGMGSGKAATFGYFLLLGFAYMFLEMGFIQKMTLLIGHPVFGVAVTLVGFLVFSGFGSLTAGAFFKKPRVIKCLVPVAVAAIVVIGIAEIAFMVFAFEWLVGFSQLWRIVFGLAITGPLAFFMGVPFPTGLRALGASRGPLVPWAWGVNGFASVTGAVLGTFLAISVGFTILAGIALACYLTAAAISGRITQTV